MADWVPPVDVSATDEDFHIEAELPEVNREDVRLILDNGVLTLQGERKKGKIVRSIELSDRMAGLFGASRFPIWSMIRR